jgi:plasmid stability protein
MASMTIRNIDDRLKSRLRIRAAENGHSMEEEARNILKSALATSEAPAMNLAQAIRRRVEAIGGLERGELQVPARQPMREPIDFGE